MSNNSITIDSIKKHIPQIKTAVSQLGYEVTVGDVSVKTGLPIIVAEHGLKQLVADYYGELKVSGEGDLVYFFPTKFRKNRHGVNAKLKESMKKVLKVLYKGFQVVYKASIMVILVLYFVIFLLLILFIMFAGRGDDNKGRSGGRGGFNIFFWFWLGSDSSRRRGYNSNDYYYNEKEVDENKKPFYKSVFEFVFGEEDPNEFLYKNLNKLVARVIQDKRGAIIPQEITPITGTKFQNTNTEVAKYVGKFESEPDVTENDSVILTFPKLMTSKARQLLDKTRYKSGNKAYYELPIKHNGNKTRSNIAMCAFNTFNLIVSGIILTGPAQFVLGLTDGKITKDVASIVMLLENYKFFFGSFPFIFSIMFFLIPALRMLYVKYRNSKIRTRNLYKAVSIAVMEKGPVVRADTLILPREAETYIGNYSDSEVEAVLNDMALSSCCSVDFDDDGNRLYNFEELMRNIEDVKEYRVKNSIGKQISESDIDYNTYEEFGFIDD